MPPHAGRTRSPRPLIRAFCPSRLAADALAQSYACLLPDVRWPLPRSLPTVATPRPRPRRVPLIIL
jgi:hypothetical protein